jgi:hypothetical protein
MKSLAFLILDALKYFALQLLLPFVHNCEWIWGLLNTGFIQERGWIMIASV